MFQIDCQRTIVTPPPPLTSPLVLTLHRTMLHSYTIKRHEVFVMTNVTTSYMQQIPTLGFFNATENLVWILEDRQLDRCKKGFEKQ